MKQNKLVIIVMFFWLFCACKTSQKKFEIKNKKSTTSSSVSNTTDNNNYPMTISFYSIGRGIDTKMKIKYDKFINEFEQKKGLKIIYEITYWGEEGETDYCFKLIDLNPKDKVEFISESKNILKESSSVRIIENTNCKNKK